MLMRRALCSLLLVLVTVAPAFAQRTTEHPGKVQIKSSASDALSVVGGGTFGGAVSATALSTTAGGVTISNNGPLAILISDTSRPTNEKGWQWGLFSATLHLYACTDGFGACNIFMRFSRSGATPTAIELFPGVAGATFNVTATSTFNGIVNVGGTITSLTDNTYDLGGDAVVQKRWRQLYLGDGGTTNNTPTSAMCNSNTQRGRMLYVENDNKLYICQGTNGWSHATLTDSGF
jgi:hypothetical protein